MNKAKLLIGALVVATALTACSKYDNPVPEPEPQPEPQPTVNIDNPNETETDQPAYAPGL